MFLRSNLLITIVVYLQVTTNKEVDGSFVERIGFPEVNQAFIHNDTTGSKSVKIVCKHIVKTAAVIIHNMTWYRGDREIVTVNSSSKREEITIFHRMTRLPEVKYIVDVTTANNSMYWKTTMTILNARCNDQVAFYCQVTALAPANQKYPTAEIGKPMSEILVFVYEHHCSNMIQDIFREIVKSPVMSVTHGRLGAQMSAACTLDNTPRKEVIYVKWTVRDYDNTKKDVLKITGNSSVNKVFPKNNWTISMTHDTNSITSTLTLHSIVCDDNKAQVTCFWVVRGDVRPMGQIHRTEVAVSTSGTLFVLVPPVTPTMKYPLPKYTGFVKLWEPNWIECAGDVGSEPCHFEWKMIRADPTDTKIPTQVYFEEVNKNLRKQSRKCSYRLEDRRMIYYRKDFNNTKITCSVVCPITKQHETIQSMVTSVAQIYPSHVSHVNLHYNGEHITYLNYIKIVEINDHFEIKCSSTGGNPAPNYQILQYEHNGPVRTFKQRQLTRVVSNADAFSRFQCVAYDRIDFRPGVAWLESYYVELEIPGIPFNKPPFEYLEEESWVMTILLWGGVGVSLIVVVLISVSVYVNYNKPFDVKTETPESQPEPTNLFEQEPDATSVDATSRDGSLMGMPGSSRPSGSSLYSYNSPRYRYAMQRSTTGFSQEASANTSERNVGKNMQPTRYKESRRNSKADQSVASQQTTSTGRSVYVTSRVSGTRETSSPVAV